MVVDQGSDTVRKKGIQPRRAGLAERARAGAGGAVVMGSNPA